MNDYIKITPLGGTGEIGGLNCMVYETKNSAIIVDCGSMFPRDEGFGLDYVIPDFSYLQSISKKLKGLVLTHGHEDHIGSIPFLLKTVSIPIYGSHFTLALVKKKTNEYPLKKIKTHQFEIGTEFTVGDFIIDTAYMSHSIIETAALNIQTRIGNIAHVTDWKIDLSPPYFPKTDMKKLSQWGKKGILALCSDSTSADRTGKTNSEKAALNQIKKHIKKHKGRVIVTLFSSNIERIQGLLNIASDLKRTVALLGRSVKSNIKIAQELGKISFKTDIIDILETEHLPDDEVMVLVTGTQGEPRAGLNKISHGIFKPFKIKSGDLVLFSSKIIPGNERNIFDMISRLEKSGAEVLFNTDPPIHASGHAREDEIKSLFQKIKPKYFLPIHGEFHHQKAHQKLALQSGIHEKNIFLLENGNTLKINSESSILEETTWGGKEYIDEPALLMRKVPPHILRERKKLAYAGVITCVLIIDKNKSKPILDLNIKVKGFIDEETYNVLFKELKENIRKLVELDSQIETSFDREQLEEEIRLLIRRFFNKKINRKPIAEVFIHEL